MNRPRRYSWPLCRPGDPHPHSISLLRWERLQTGCLHTVTAPGAQRLPFPAQTRHKKKKLGQKEKKKNNNHGDKEQRSGEGGGGIYTLPVFSARPSLRLFLPSLARAGGRVFATSSAARYAAVDGRCDRRNVSSLPSTTRSSPYIFYFNSPLPLGVAIRQDCNPVQRIMPIG